MDKLHILNEVGILTSFSVAKKVTEEEIQIFFDDQKKKGVPDSKIGELLREKIVGDIDIAMKNNEIPGLISINDISPKKNIQDISEINRLILIISNRLCDKNYNKTTLCYFINALVNILQLDEKAFEDFHNLGEDDAEDDGDDSLC